ncbi:uncharacterized protein EV420DRAFT_1664726 [Desarmillaria tabescens]|uniref:Uncharacterized protein n=1 Tax=Armillaria tabescens TaxID=1929756 RepID=A0AA39TWM3_ARMTA|nr:uncharacterized protein EV420DRAFT_1664726 [Desarmillaria tabescens]KAK0461715.1 hypothetical protein EV420DRAFT_1664726 [Desarmillaria tabescens]
MLGRISSTIRRRSANRFILTLRHLSSSSPIHQHRTVRVGDLTAGYNVTQVVKAIKANPVEKILEKKDHLLVQFFDGAAAKHCLERHTDAKSLTLTIDEEGSPKLSAKIVAGLGAFNLSREFRLENLPETATEDRLRKNEPVYRRCRHIFARELDADLRKTRVVYINDNDNYDLPDWYTETEDDGPVQRMVSVNGASSEVKKFIRQSVRTFEKDHLPVLSLCIFPATNNIVMRFPTANFARSFVDIHQADASKLGADLVLEYDDRTDYVTRGMVTALNLGARRTVRLVSRQNRMKQTVEYYKIFRQFGRLITIMPQVRAETESTIVAVVFEDIGSAMKCILGLAKSGRSFLGVDTMDMKGTKVNFFGTRTLAPISMS